jgi:hypothetical protein
MNVTGPVLPKPLPQRVLKFLGEWLSSTVSLFIDPTNSLPVYKSQAQIVSCVKRDIIFSGSCLFVSSLMYLVVLTRSGYESWRSYLPELTSMTVLLLVFWILYAIIVAATIKVLGGSVEPQLNVSFGVKVLSTFYLVATAIAVIVFLASGGNENLFTITIIVIRIVLPLLFMPAVFLRPNNINGGKKVAYFYVVIFILASTNAVISKYMLVSNPIAGGGGGPIIFAPPNHVF